MKKTTHGLISLRVMVLAAAVSASPSLAQAPQAIGLDGHAGGPRFDGIGVVEGGGGTGVLLKDYPQAQRSQILDMVFKPMFGASVSALYVEIPGDGNSTQGSMPSHRHTRDDLNAWRGYMWWEMKEARRRNPELTLDGAAWSAPGWVGEHSHGDFFSQDAADYYVSWLKLARDVHGVPLSALGMRNERGVNLDFAKTLRRTLDADGFADVKIHGFDNWPDDKLAFVPQMETDKDLRDAIAILSAHNSPPGSVTPPDVLAAAARMGKPLWDTEQHVYKPGFDGLISTVQSFNLNHIDSGYTKITDWYGIAGLYEMEPYSGQNEATVRANWPWSGHYEVNEKLWAYAHYGQFSRVGWHYLDKACGKLDGGGSFVTLVSPKGDYSVIIETKDAKGPQTVRLTIGGGLSTKALAVWRSNAQSQFARQADLVPVHGAVTLTLEPNAAYSLTTTRGQKKGGFDGVPAPHAFPFPYYDSFDEYADPASWGYLPRYLADIADAFELSPCPDRAGQCLRQAVPAPTLSWAPDWKPYTIIGDDHWRDYETAADVRLGAGERGAVMGRINHVGWGYGSIPKGYFLELSAGGDLRLVVIRGKPDKKALVGDAEQQALIRNSRDDSEGGEKVLATLHADGVGPDQWHRLGLRFEGNRITGLLDGKAVLTATDDLYDHGMAGLQAGADDHTVDRPWFDNLAITPPGAAGAAPPAVPAKGSLYPRR
jgi:galactosylceramidase